MISIFGLTCLLFYLKLSCGNGLFYNLRTTDPVVYTAATKYKKERSRFIRRELDLSFVKECMKFDVLPNFTDWKVLKKRGYRERLKERKRLLKNELQKAHADVKALWKKQELALLDFRNCCTYLKYHAVKYVIDKLVNSEKATAKMRKDSKLTRLVLDKRNEEGIEDNPNLTITNLTNEPLNEEDLNVLKLGLKYGIALRPRESDLVVKGETLWDQIVNKQLLKPGLSNEIRAKTAIKSLTYSLLDLDTKRYFTDSKRMKIIKSLRKKFAILKPDKGNGIVLLKNEDYYNCVQRIFDDRTKFEVVEKDPTVANLKTLQTYLNKLEDRKEISEEVKQRIRPKCGKYGRAHGQPKMHKAFDNLPSFRPIVDCMGTVYSKLGKYLSELLYPLSVNEHSIKDSFDMANAIKSIPKTLIDEGYVFVSFDVTSLFTNVPLKKTVDIILDRVYNMNLIQTDLKKRTLKKLILDTCTKTVFSFNNVLYKQTDGVCMGSNLGPIISNIIMTEFEKVIVSSLLTDKILAFYKRYVDDTLALIKQEDIPIVLKKFNSFHPNLKFTIDTFDDGVVHFLDLRIDTNLDIDIYHKDTSTGQYVHFDSFVPWNYRISWARSLHFRYNKLCSTASALKSQIDKLKSFMSWNGYPKHTRDVLVNKFSKIISNNGTGSKGRNDEECVIIFLKLPYLGPTGDFIINSFKRKLKRLLVPTVKFRISFTTNKLSMFCSLKDKYPLHMKTNLIYKFTCPHCQAQYIGKTERNLVTRCGEHAKIPVSGESPNTSAIFAHLNACPQFVSSVRGIADSEVDEWLQKFVLDNIEMLACNNNWLELCFLESYFIKILKPTLNGGLKAAKDLLLFN